MQHVDLNASEQHPAFGVDGTGQNGRTPNNTYCDNKWNINSAMKTSIKLQVFGMINVWKCNLFFMYIRS